LSSKVTLHVHVNVINQFKGTLVVSKKSTTEVVQRLYFEEISRDVSFPPCPQENSVQCTCRGFKVPDVIRLCQAYRTHSLEDVQSKLKDSLCSFCSHPLLSHRPVPGVSRELCRKEFPLTSVGLRKAPPLGPHHGLCLKASSSLALSPANPKCVELMSSSLLRGGFFSLLVLGKEQEDQKLPELALFESSGRDVTCSTSSTSEGAAQTPVTEETHRRGEVLSESDKPMLPVAKKAKLMPAVAVRGKKSRRSSRLATRKTRMEEVEVRRTLKGLKGARRLYEEDGRRKRQVVKVRQRPGS